MLALSSSQFEGKTDVPREPRALPFLTQTDIRMERSLRQGAAERMGMLAGISQLSCDLLPRRKGQIHRSIA